jgi:hypothetical protein
MNTIAEVMPLPSAISRGTVLKRFFVIGYVTAIVVAQIGWLSAFGWITFKLVR